MKNSGRNTFRHSTIVLPIAAALLTAAAYLLYCAFYGFYPLGGRSFVWCDLEQQYLPLVMELKGVFSEGGSLFLGRGGGGMDLYGVFLFFVSSPLSLLTLAVDNEDMLMFINVLTIIKASLCAASAELWFVKAFPKLRAPFGVLMSMMYAMSGYVMMYYQNNMWLDMMILFPILLIALFRLSGEGKWGMYSVCLALAMLLNFYISFMIVLYLLLAGAALLLFCCDKDRRGEVAVKLILGDICAALMSAAVWIPAFIQFSSSGRSSSSLHIFITGAADDNIIDKSALLSCTGILLASAVAAIVLHKRLMRGRPAFFAVMSVLLVAAVFIGPANKLWHTGSYQAYPLRYGFIVIIMLMSLCAELLQTAPADIADDGINPFYGGALAMIFVLGALTAVGVCHRDKLDSYSHTLWTDIPDGLRLIGIGLAASALYFLLIYGYISGKLNLRFTAFVMSFALICESLLGFSVYFDGIPDSRDRFSYASDSLTNIPDDDDYFRVKVARRFYYSNMVEGFGYASLGHYTSLTDQDFLYASKRLGYSSYWMDASSCGGTVYSDAFLMNRYIVGRYTDVGMFSTLVHQGEDLEVYRNDLALGGALVCTTPPEELADYSSYERADSAEFLASRLFGVSGTVKKIEPTSLVGVTITESDGKIHIVPDEGAECSEIRYSIDVRNAEELYFDAFGDYSTLVKEKYFDTLSVTVSGGACRDSYPDSLFSGMLYLGTFHSQTVDIVIGVNEPVELTSFGVCSIDVLPAAAAIKSAKTAPITTYRNKVTMDVTAKRGEWLYIPMLMLDGYDAEINGEPAELHRVLGAFMALELKPGENEVVLRFIPKGFRAGAVLSCAGFVLFTALLVLTKRRKINAALGRAAEASLLSAGAFTALALYVISCVVWVILRLARLF
ncbi:MAG: YfhO family protein [Ruminococcus sp.]|nr:YfhO family protein [Ruminococcus sp.]